MFSQATQTNIEITPAVMREEATLRIKQKMTN